MAVGPRSPRRGCRPLALTAHLTLHAQTPPQLVSVTPAIGETNAAPRDSVVFVFDQAMDFTPLLTTAGAVVGNYQFTPINAQSGFTGSWSADRKTLKTIETEDMPIAYLPGNALRARVRIVGDVVAGS